VKSEAVLRADERGLPVLIAEEIEHGIGDLDDGDDGTQGVQALSGLLGDELGTKAGDPQSAVVQHLHPRPGATNSLGVVEDGGEGCLSQGPAVAQERGCQLAVV